MKSLYMIVCLLWVCNSLYSQFQWEHTGGPEGQGNFEIYNNKDFAFLYDGSHLYRTGDGQSWELINATASGKFLVSENRILLYTEEYNNQNEIKEIHIQSSADNGENWYNVPVHIDAYDNNNQIMLCTHGIYLKAGENLYRTQTDGQSWKQVSYDSIPFSSLFSSNNIIFGISAGKVFEFNPQSGKWVSPWNAPPHGYIGAVHIDGPNIIVVGFNFYYSSSNRGETWKTFGSSSVFNTHLAEKDGKVYFHSGQLLRHTNNAGQNWQSILLNKNYQKYCLFKNKFLLFSAEYGCVSYDDITNEYLPANKGINSASISSLLTSEYYVWAVGVNNVLHKLDTRTQEWTSLPLPEVAHRHFTLKTNPAGNLLYYNFHAQKFQVSTDYGVSWKPLNPSGGPHLYVDNFGWIDQQIFAQVYPNQYISSDFGATWETLNQRFTSPVEFRGRIWAIDDFGKIIVSTDSARSWSYPDLKLDYIISIFANEDRIFVVSQESQNILYSSVDGINWQFSGDGLNLRGSGPEQIPGLLAWSKNDTHYLMNENSFLYYSIDNCSTWEQVALPYVNQIVTFLNDTIYIGHYSGGGVLKSSLPDLSGKPAKGSIFNDLNGNGIKDLDEPYLAGVQVRINTSNNPSKSYFTLSNQDGQFEIRPSLESNDTLIPKLLSEYVENIDPPYYVIHDSIENYDFAVHFQSNVTDGAIGGKYNILPYSGDHLSAHIAYFNKGTEPLSGSVGVKLNPGFIYTTAYPMPSAIINTDSLVWHFQNLPIFGRNEILIEGNLSPALPDGASVSLSGTLLPDQTDINLSDNQFFIPGIFEQSAEPNTKSVIPEEGMTIAEMLEGKELEYTIRFQNPFDEEINSVQISDALATSLDYNSIRITGSSHEITKWELLPSGILRIFFDNMNLSPKSDDQRSQGFLSFAVRIRKDSNHNFNILNRANIIFENTRTITTNTVSSKMIEDVILSTEEFTKESYRKLIITPNPASDNCSISTNTTLGGKGTIRVFDLNGRLLYIQVVDDLRTDILLQTNQLMNGFYQITAEGAQGIMHGKLIIQK